MEEKFDEMYMNNSSIKHAERAEEKKRKRETHKKIWSHITRNDGDSAGNRGTGKSLNISSQILSSL